MWNEEQDKTILDLWNAGSKASVIAEAVGGKSRCAVLGRLHRLRGKGVEVKEYIRVPRPVRDRRPRAQRFPAAPRPRQALHARPVVRTLEPLPPPVVVLKPGEVEPNGTPAGLIELCTAACRWPVSAAPPHLFCNKIRRGGSSYCDEHFVRSLQPARLPVDSSARSYRSSGRG